MTPKPFAVKAPGRLLLPVLFAAFLAQQCSAPAALQQQDLQTVQIARKGVWADPTLTQGPSGAWEGFFRQAQTSGWTDIALPLQESSAFIQAAKSRGFQVHAVLREEIETETLRRSLEALDWDGLILTNLPEARMEILAAEALLLKPYLRIGATTQQQATPAFADYTVRLSENGQLTAGFPVGLKKIHPSQALALKMPRPGTWTLSYPGGVASRTTDAQGWIAAILPRLPDTLFLEGPQPRIALPTSGWRLPYRYAISQTGLAARTGAWVELRRFPGDPTRERTFPFLGKAGVPAVVSLQGQTLKQYQTGIFFQDIALQPGVNRIRLEAEYPDRSRAAYFWETQVDTITPAPRTPPWIDSASVTPEQSVQGLSSDMLRISFRGSKNGSAVLELTPGKLKLPLERRDFGGYSLYQTDLHFERLKTGTPYALKLLLQDSASGKKTTHQIPSTVQVNPPYAYPLLKVIQDKAPLSYNLGPIRLGGPQIAEYPKGIVLQASGKTGDQYRVRLDDTDEGYIAANAVQPLPAGASRPAYFLQTVSVAPSENADVLRIPYAEPVPYAVHPLPQEQMIRIRLYGVKTSSTWMSHRAGLRMIDYVHWEQHGPETYDLLVHLTTADIWGYTLQIEGGSLVLRVKYPPVLAQENGKSIWKGFKIAIEAGHGGNNTGAEGLSGLLEKDVNLDVSLRLEKLCRDAGMDVLQVRPTDTYMTLEQKRAMIERSDARLHVSIHANSGGGGYLRTGGVSIYYHNPFWEPFARIMYQSMLKLDLAEFGTVGSFNYHVTRIASRPSILVELAFLSHAEDEEKLASPEYRQRMAEQIFSGIAEYLNR